MNEAVGFYDFIEADGYIWFAASNYNALFRLALSENCLEYMGSFPGEPMLGHSLYRSVVMCEDRLIFAPFMAGSIGEYSIKSGEFIEHEKLDDSDTKFKFETAVLVEKKVFFMPQNYGYIVIYDLEEGQISYDACLKDVFSIDKQDGAGIALGIGISTSDVPDCVYVPRRFSGDMIKYNFRQKKCDYISLEDKNVCLLINVIIDDWVWMLPGKNVPLMKWNIVTGEKKVYSGIFEEDKEAGAPYIRAVDCGNKIVFWREYAGSSLIYDKKTDEFDKMLVSYDPKENLRKNPWSGNFYFAKRLDGDRVLGVSKKDHAMVILDIEKMKITSCYLKMSGGDVRKFNRQIIRSKIDVDAEQLLNFENSVHSLDWLFEFMDMTSNKPEKKNVNNNIADAGRMIYEATAKNL